MRSYQRLSMIGIDLGKTCFHCCGVDKGGKVLFRKKLSRRTLFGFLRELPRVSVAFEACGGAHFLARQLLSDDFEVRVIPPQYVKPYVKTNKNDWKDAEAICEAATRSHMSFVGVKSVEQQELQMIHRMRSRLIKHRTAVVNECRGFLLEVGVIFPRGIEHARRGIPELLEGGELGFRLKGLLSELYDELCLLDERIGGYDRLLKQIAREVPACSRLLKMRGIGPICATALYASTTPELFKNGRQFAASLGLVPKQDTTGGKPRLLGISKRGDKYLRQLLIHGGRSVVRAAAKDNSQYGQWVQRVKENKIFNKASVAVANKNARIAWVLLTQEEEFNPQYEQCYYKEAA